MTSKQIKQHREEPSIPISFNEYGEAEFNGWVSRYANHEVTSKTATAYFNAISNFEDAEIVARIELGQADTVNYQPAVFDVTREMVQYARTEIHR